MKNYAETVQEFRYTKKEIFTPLFGIFGILLFMGILLMVFFIPHFFYKINKLSCSSVLFFLVACFIGVIYFLYMWLRRRSFKITLNNEKIIIYRFDKIQEINWRTICSYVYQCGNPFWFLRLYLINDGYINLNGELGNFDELIMIIKRNIKIVKYEFEYTMRKKNNFILYCALLFFNIIVIIPSVIYGFIGRAEWNAVLCVVLIFLVLTFWNVFSQLRKTQDKFFISQEGITMKPWLKRGIFITWKEIINGSEVIYDHVQLALTMCVSKITIKVGDQSISFYEDIDNVDELIAVINNKTGLSLSL
ncbi:MAG: hypothetical protein ABIH18_02795 [Candidatus Omnitrophota bacterium]